MKDIFIVPGLGQDYVELEDMILLSEEYVKAWITETKALAL